jgi:ATP-dependent Lon protease
MIQIGGENNGSVLQGHNYTYVGSKWGSIVQILMDKKCMNPIIFIDEIDKISKTENGKEITGILTHLLDSTQNDCFQDKYFSGINIDLSKCLIILSYNDAENIDKILLDRIHRIKFDFLSTENKIIICKNYLLPEIYRNLGLEGVVQIEDSVLEFIIEKYTYESGVRKLKEHLYDLFREINLDVLKHEETQQLDKLHIVVNEEDIENRYFKKKYKIINKKIHKEDSVGIINCLWTNNLGQGGILSASSKLFPSGKFLELKLTGLLDDIMKESLNISLTNAYELLNLEEREVVHTKYDGDKKYGIHIHMGDGSVHKSGTSAGIAITLLVYSLLTNKKIKNNYAVTGEAGDLFGSSSEIGGLETKIIHGIKAGVKNFIFPKENELDFNTFMEKYKNNKIIEGVNFYAITNIKEAIELIIY